MAVQLCVAWKFSRLIAVKPGYVCALHPQVAFSPPVANCHVYCCHPNTASLCCPGWLLPGQAIARCWWGRSVRFATEDMQETSTSPQHSAPIQLHQQQHTEQSADKKNPAQQQQQQHAEATGVPYSNSSRGGIRPEQQALLQLFVDLPGPQAPFSIHSLCTAGAPHG
jgi:hypothetical protein